MHVLNRSFLSITAVAAVTLLVLAAAGAFPVAARADQDSHEGSDHHDGGDNATTIHIIKIMDADGNLETTNDQTPGAGWQFTVGQATVTTDGAGLATVHADSGNHEVTEVPQDGFTLVSASCIYNHSDDNSDNNEDHHNGHFDRDNHRVSDIQSDDNDLHDEDSEHHHHHDGNDHKSITCTFYNQPSTATIVASKVVCNSEADLPNWSDTQHAISATTAADYVAAHPDTCHLAADWSFQWAPTSASNPGDNTGAAVSPWTTFTGSISVPMSSVDESGQVWVREVMQDGYVPFSGVEGSNVSAEMWCNADVLHYDNYDYARGLTAGATEYCVAFNALACTTDLSSQTIVSDTSTQQNSQDSVFVSPINVRWTAVIDSGAAWIWGENPISDPTIDITETFTKTFTVTGTPTGATLDIAADNSYSVSVNGHAECADATEFNYQSSPADDASSGQDVCTIPAGDLLSGSNTITFAVKNWGRAGAHTGENPGGLMYKLVVNQNSCVPPVDVCPQGQHFNSDHVCTPDVPECSANQILVENQCVSCGVNQHVVENQCVDNTTPTDVCANIAGDQSEAPAGTHIDGINCVENGTSSGGDEHHDGGGNGPIVGLFGGGNGPIQGSVLGASTGLPSGCTALLTQYMRKGKSNDPEQVKLLQQFLNDEMHSNLPITGYFGSLTDAAVRAFQKKYPESVLTPWGLGGPTGLVYKTTERWINLLHCSSLNIPMPELTPWTE